MQGFVRRIVRDGARVAIVAAALVASGCDSAEERVQRHYERGLTLVAEGSDEKASLEFRNALRIQREFAPARLELGKLQERGGDLRGAVRNYRAAVDLNPEDAESRRRLAQLMIVSGDLAEARSLIEDAARIAPSDPDILAVKGALELQVGNAEAALTAARAALAIAPDHVDANLVLVGERIRAGDLETARSQVDELLSKSPQEMRYDLLKLRILAGAQDSAGIETQLRHMADTYEEAVEYRQGLAQLLYERGALAEAEIELRRIADSQPGELQPAADLARLMLRSQGYEAARIELAGRADAAPTPELKGPLLRALAEFDLANGRADSAQAVLESFIAAGGQTDEVSAARVQLARILYYWRQDQAGARTLIDAVIEDDPKNVDALALRAAAAIEDDRPAEAIADLRLARDVDPNNPELMLLEASAHEREGNLRLAGERLAAAARASNFEPETAGRYVRFLIGQSDLKGAEAILTDITRRNPTAREPLADLAEIRLKLQNWAGAEQAAEALRTLGPEEAAAADKIAAASLRAQGRAADGVKLLERLVADPATQDGAMRNLVAAYVTDGEIAKAAAFLDGVLEGNPANVVALLLRADIDLRQSQPDRAAARLETAIAAAPTAPTPYLVLSRLHLGNGRLDEAERVARDGVSKAADTEMLRFMLAQIAEQRRDFDAAIAEYSALYGMNSASPIYANNLASLLAEHRADDPASLEQAVRVAQRLRGYDVPYFQDTYGWVMYLKGDIDAAIASIAPAAEALSDNALVRYHAGRVHASAGQIDLARQHLEAALSIDPTFPRAESARAALAALLAAPAAGQ